MHACQHRRADSVRLWVRSAEGQQGNLFATAHTVDRVRDAGSLGGDVSDERSHGRALEPQIDALPIAGVVHGVREGLGRPSGVLHTRRLPFIVLPSATPRLLTDATPRSMPMVCFITSPPPPAPLRRRWCSRVGGQSRFHAAGTRRR